jgi:competence protein CoiA
MRFAIVNGEKKEAGKGLSGFCLGCTQPMIAKCGPIKIKHWAHKSSCSCDRWWENETEWHRNWKNNFPLAWQEVRQQAADGEWHIADVKTVNEFVIECQHSFLKSKERHSRNEFYGKQFVWVIDGLTRKNDRPQFESILKTSKQILQNIPLIQVTEATNSALLRDWSDCRALVFFDFGSEYPLWCLLPKSSRGLQYVLPVARQQFVSLHLAQADGQGYASFESNLNLLVFNVENPRIVPAQQLMATNRPMQQRRITPVSSAEARALYKYISRTQGSGRTRRRF